MNNKITIKDFINPFKTGSAMLSVRALHAEYMSRYMRLIEPTIKAKCWEEKGEYYVHLEVPSESNMEKERKVFYDVIYRFDTKDKTELTNNHIYNYNCEAFCNNPSFAFSFTYVFNKNKCLLSNASKKLYSAIALKEPPKVRNPYNLLGISKDLWYAEYYMRRNQLFRKEVFNNIAVKTTLNTELVKVKSQDDKLKELNDRDKEDARIQKKLKENTRSQNKRQKEMDKKEGKKLLEADLKHNFDSGLQSEKTKALTVNFKNPSLSPKK
jgi:hypothetical protein